MSTPTTTEGARVWTLRLSHRVAVLLGIGAAALVGAGLVLVGLVLVKLRAKDPDRTRIAEPVTDFSERRPAFPLALAPGNRYLVDHDGKPFFIHGDAGWSMIAQLTREDAERYLEDRHRRGFNLVMVNLIEHWFADHPPFDVHGNAPFRVAGDFSTPNPEYFARARELVGIARQKGIAVLLCPAYLGGDGGHEGWFQEMRENGPDKLEGYGAYVGAQFREFDNVLWLEGGDFTPPAADLRLVDAVARGIKRASPAQLQTAHWNPETSALDVQLPSVAFDLNTTYTYLPAYLKSREDDGHGQGRAHFLIETKYEHERESTQRFIRAQAYYALLTGASGEIYGSRWIYDFTRPTLWHRLIGHEWVGSLDSPAARSMGFVRTFVDAIAWQTLVPDERYAILVTGQGSQGSMNYPVLASSRDGRLAVAYAPHDPVTIDLAKLSSPVRARWYDPTNGQYVAAAGSPFSAGGLHEFAQPGRNAAGDDDWLLLLQAVE